MGAKQNKCCCCPPCNGPTECCDCTCRWLCVTFTPDDYTCDAQATELAWGGAAFSGSLAGADLYYYFEREQLDSEHYACYFKLRSSALGYPEGYERKWLVSTNDPDLAYATAAEDATSCGALATEVVKDADYGDANPCAPGVIRTECAVRVVPDCAGCDCACECLCVNYYKCVGCKGTGLLCATFDPYSRRFTGEYSGTISCDDGSTLDLSIRYGKRGEFPCVDDPENGPYVDDCYNWDPYAHDECVLVASVGGAEAWAWPGCPEIAAAWSIDMDGDGYPDVTISARCAKCGDCDVGCCDRFTLPDQLNIEMTITGDGAACPRTLTGIMHKAPGGWQTQAGFDPYTTTQISVACVKQPDGTSAFIVTDSQPTFRFYPIDGRCKPIRLMYASTSQTVCRQPPDFGWDQLNPDFTGGNPGSYWCVTCEPCCYPCNVGNPEKVCDVTIEILIWEDPGCVVESP